MAPRRVQMVLTVSLVVALWGLTAAQNDSSCNNVLISLSPCLDYVTGNAPLPSSACCSQLGSVVSSQPQCLCEVVNGAASSVGININQTRALTLPTACGVQTPPLSICEASSPTSDSPAVTTSFPSGNGYSTFSSTSGNGRSSSLGNSVKQPSSLLGFFTFVTCLCFALTWK
ncbi:non-specific lipid-transfer protein 4.1-like [Neltuma alba]|uniref:non-specific lipid-transfer protein 4.1-like n=1 Tax=Neltuma alba TaxID=207710 RepID=UPI0010A407B6|nr:non-specific lipid-transfer protein 4.1-like [Prosopis alba]